ncbi:MAG: hypothetical protein OXH86_15855 [Acidimicrobiaceae bacterium]|nr:hypothetical protein [Acidimicrobiaceae bacterium]MDE0498824.1 hypothetical protein [Acidimicrobiaceae bacterium]
MAQDPMSRAANGGGGHEGRPRPAGRPQPAPVPGGGVRASSPPGRGERLAAVGLLASLAAVVLMALVFIGDALGLLAFAAFGLSPFAAVAGIAMCIAARSGARHRAARSRAAAGIVVGVLALLAWVLLVIAAISALNDFFT